MRIQNPLEKGSCSTLTIAVHQHENTSHVMLTNREVYERTALVEKGEIIPTNTPWIFSMKYQSKWEIPVLYDFKLPDYLWGLPLKGSAVIRWLSYDYSHPQSLLLTDWLPFTGRKANVQISSILCKTTKMWNPLSPAV